MLYLTRFPPEEALPRERFGDEHEAVRRLLLYAMTREYGLKRIPEETAGPYGKPLFRDHPACFSLSHTKGAMCCAVFPFPVGADVEHPRPIREALLNRVCTEEEQAFLRAASDMPAAFCLLWSLKESRMKLSGEGLRFGPKNARFLPDGAGGWRSAEPGIEVRAFTLPDGDALTLCAASPLPEDFLTVPPEYLPDARHIY